MTRARSAAPNPMETTAQSDLFEASLNPARVIFGSGTLSRVSAEAERLGLERILVLSTPTRADQAERVADLLRTRAQAIFSKATMHTPVDITEEVLALVHERRIDGLVSIGGGSTIGLGKAIAFRTDLPQIVVPTTYSGSEMTQLLGETRDGVKVTHRDSRILPEVVIYDADLTLTLPSAMSVASGMNGIAHAVEALYAKDGNPMVSLLAEEGVRALFQSLPRLVTDPVDRNARSKAFYGSWLCGYCLGSVGMALHHKLCHVLGGAFDLPHAEMHTIILPHVLAFNAPAVPEAILQLARATASADPVRALYDSCVAAGVPRSLEALGMPSAGIERAIHLAMERPYWNPRPVTRSDLSDVLIRAFNGRAPEPLA